MSKGEWVPITLSMDTEILILYNVDVHKILKYIKNIFSQQLKTVKTICSSWALQKQVVGQIWSSGSI